MADKELSVRLKFDTKSAENSIDRITKRLNQLNTQLDKVSNKNSTTGLNAQRRTEQSIANQVKSTSQLNSQLHKSNQLLSKNNSALRIGTQYFAQSNRWANVLNRVSGILNGIRTGFTTVTTRTRDIVGRVREWFNRQRDVNNETRRTNSSLGNAWRTLRGIAGTYLSMMSLKSVLDTSDTITSARNRLNYANAQILGDGAYDSNGGYSAKTFEATQLAMDKMYASSQKVRMSYSDMMSMVGKSMALAGEAFGNNTDNAIRFQEIMSEAYTIGGASAEEMSASMGQMIQALNSGQFAGDELRSVREGAPLAYKAIEEFAQKVWDTDESLKQLGADGKVSSEMVIQAILGIGDSIDEAFNKTEMTFGQAWNMIKNSAIQAFRPLSEQLSSMLTRAFNNGAFEKIESFFVNVSKVLMIAFAIIEKIVIWIANNWNWLKYVIGAALIVIGALLIRVALIATWSAITTAMSWLWANRVLIIIALTVAALIYVFLQWKSAMITTCEAVTNALLIVGIAILLIGILTLNTTLIVIGAIVLLLGIIFMFFEEVCGGVWWLVMFIINLGQLLLNVIGGILGLLAAAVVNIIFAIINIIIWAVNLIIDSIQWLGATILNIAIGVINACLEAVYAFISPFISIIEFILNRCNGGFNTFGDAVANLIGQIIGWFLSLGKVVTKIIDAIFGTDWTSGLSSLQDKVMSWGKNEQAITLTEEAPAIKRIEAGKAFESANYLNFVDSGEWMTTAATFGGEAFESGWSSDAYNTGAEWGNGVKNSLNKWGGQFQDPSKDYSLDAIGKKLGLDFSGITHDGAGQALNTGGINPSPTTGGYDPTSGSGFPRASDPRYGTGSGWNPLTDDELKNTIDGIGNDTGKIADSMELTEEDLKYLRDVANMEWKKEFTTATIQIDMKNNNTINGDADLEGIVTKLTDRLYEEMDAMANGVYAY